MAVEVSERWSDEKLHKDFNSTQWTAIRTFDVAGVTDAQAAALASGSPYGSIPRIGEQHPRTSSMAVRSIDPERTGFSLFKVTVNYGVGTFDNQEDPLLKKPRIKWGIGSESLPVDHDADGNPLLNSALDAFDPPLSTEFTTIFLSITRNEPYFDVQKALTFSNRININPFNIKGAGIVAPGQILCRSIQPAGEYIEGVRFVPIVYDFELRSGLKLDSDGLWDGFKYRILDQGLRAFYSKTEKGRIYDADQRTAPTKSPVTTDVRLDGKGGIYNVQATNGAFLLVDGLSIISMDQPGSPKGSILDTTDSAVFLKYKRIKTIDFSGLGL